MVLPDDLMDIVDKSFWTDGWVQVYPEKGMEGLSWAYSERFVSRAREKFPKYKFIVMVSPLERDYQSRDERRAIFAMKRSPKIRPREHDERHNRND